MSQQEQPPLTQSMRATLKAVIQQEVEKLPAQLEAMEAKDRVSALCKLMPYVFPRVDSVSLHDGEPIGSSVW